MRISNFRNLINRKYDLRSKSSSSVSLVGRKSCLLLALLFGLSSIVSLVSYSTDVSAASAYDNAYLSTDNVKVGLSVGDSGSPSLYCNDTDISKSWVSFITDESNPWFDADKKAEFNSALDNGSWGVSNHYTTTSYTEEGRYGRKVAYVYFNGTQQMPMTWSNRYITISNATVLVIDCNATTHELTAYYDGSNLTRAFSYNPVYETDPWSKTYNFFMNTTAQNIPEGYEGTVPPTTPDIKTRVHPDLEYQVKNRDLKVQYLKNIPNASRINWQIFNADDEGISTGDPIYEKFGNQISNNPNLDYKFEKQGKYVLVAGVESYPPFLPIPPELDVQPRVVQLNIDGTSYEGNTEGEECDDGYCQVVSPLEDCGTYGTDLIGGIGCQFRNFLVSLGIAMRFLFIPNPDFIEDYWTDITEFMSNKLGFLYGGIAFIVTLLTNAITATANPDCVLTFAGKLWGQDFAVNGCAMQQTFPAFFPMMQTLVIGGTVVVLIFAAQRKYHEVLEQR